MVQRAKTLGGLILQYAKTRWGGLGKRTKLFLIGGLVLAALAAFQFGACMFGACGAGPCSAARQSPCSLSAAEEGDEPCPYAQRAEAEEEAAAVADEDVPPCHRQ